MSAYGEFRTEFKDRDALISALCEVGIADHALTREQIEVHPDGDSLYGYHGDRRAQKAHVIIRRRNVRSSANDVGFELVNGRYSARISDFDRGQGTNDAWLGKLAQSYSKSLVHKKAKALGYRVHESVNADGSVKMVLQR